MTTGRNALKLNELVIQISHNPVRFHFTKGSTMNSENTTDLAVVSSTADADKAMAGLSGSRQKFMTTLDRSSDEGQLALYNAMTEALPLTDHLNTAIDLVGYTAQIVEFNNEEKEKQEGIRLILTDANGVSFSCMSDGIMKSIETLVGVYGDPSSWKSPKRVKAVEEGKKPRAYLTLKAVSK